MADPFNLIRTPKLVFGPGKSVDIPDLLKDRGKRIIVLTGSASFSKNQAILNALALLEQRKFILNFERIGREPTPADIDAIIHKYDPPEIDIVISFGGGSVLDAGKAVSAMLLTQGTVKDYLEGVGTKTHTGDKKFFVAVPATAGTGSEATSNAVISETGPGGFKKSLRHENFVPDIAVVDPLMTVDCPSDITASSGMDAFTQLVESYLSLKANSFTDALALDGIGKIRNSLERAFLDGHDVEARGDMAFAAYLSGITLANAGLGLVHGFASAIGGYFHAPHGAICGTLMAAVNRFNISSLLSRSDYTPTHEKYAALGKLLSGRTDCNPRWCLEYAANYFEELTEKLNIKRLSAFGIKESDIAKIISASDHKANPVKFDTGQMADMLRLRL